MLCAKVKLKEAEKAKQELVSKGIADLRFKMLREGEFFYIPVSMKSFAFQCAKDLKKSLSMKKIKGYNLAEKKLEKRKERKSFSEAVKERLTKEELRHLNTAFDVVGDIAIIEVDKELENKEKEIANVLLETNSKIRTVVKKKGEHKGEFRIQDYGFLAGVKKFETVHKESGAAIKLDIRKVYFSPRLAGERLRIANLIKANERVLVMFSGVGIYPFVFARHSKASKILGVEINPDACRYANESLRLNKFNNVELVCADVRDYFRDSKEKFDMSVNRKAISDHAQKPQVFDRIAMPLPKGADSFLDVAKNLVKKGGIIHFYFFDREDVLEDYSKLNSLFSKHFKRFKILKVVKAGQQSPGVYRLCADVLIE